MTETKRNLSLDVLKFVLALMIVAIHSGFLNDISRIGSHLTINGLFRIAVPLFFLINGFYFCPALESNPAKWFRRILTLYVFWMLFYLPFWLRFDNLTLREFVKTVLTLLLGFQQLWYLSALIGAAILLSYLKNLSAFQLLFISVLLFAIGLSIQYTGSHHLFANDTIDFVLNELWVYRNFLFFGFPFFTIGYLLYKTKCGDRIKEEYLIPLSFLGLLFLLIESYLNYDPRVLFRSFDFYLSLLIACPLLFLAVMKTDIPINSKKLSIYANAVFFIHPCFISLYGLYILDRRTLLTLLTILSSLVVSFLLIQTRKITRIPL